MKLPLLEHSMIANTVVWLPSLDICFEVPYACCTSKSAPNWWVIFFHAVSDGKFCSLKVLTPQPGFTEYFFCCLISLPVACVPSPATLLRCKPTFLTVHEGFNRLNQFCHVFSFCQQTFQSTSFYSFHQELLHAQGVSRTLCWTAAFAKSLNLCP